MNDNSTRAALAAVFDDVASAFGGADLARLRPLYALPLLLVGNQGTVAVNDAAAFDTVFGGMLAKLTPQGFARSVWRDMTYKQVADDLALAAMHWTRHRTDGSVLEELGATYTLLRQDGRWRITAILGHDPDRIPVLS